MASSDSVVDVDKDGIEVSRSHDADLQFQSIPHSSSQGDQREGTSEQLHAFTNFPDPHESDEEDKSTLLDGDKKQPSFWTFEYYQQFFDVDTNQVLRRILGSMVPNPRANYLQNSIRPNPDLYGPFWICSTLVFTTAIAGNLSDLFYHLSSDHSWTLDFNKVTLAATVIFSYWWVMPTLLWGLLYWRGNQAGLSFLEISCVYGYSLAIYIPISLLWLIPSNVLPWILVFIGMALSGTVLLLTFWPALREDSFKIAVVAMVVMFLFHGALAVGFVLYFFHVTDGSNSSSERNFTIVSAATTTATTTTTASALTKQL